MCTSIRNIVILFVKLTLYFLENELFKCVNVSFIVKWTLLCMKMCIFRNEKFEIPFKWVKFSFYFPYTLFNIYNYIKMLKIHSRMWKFYIFSIHFSLFRVDVSLTCKFNSFSCKNYSLTSKMLKLTSKMHNLTVKCIFSWVKFTLRCVKFTYGSFYLDFYVWSQILEFHVCNYT